MTPAKLAIAFTDAWNAKWAEGLRDLFAPDARFINVFGHVLKDVDKIVEAHDRAYDTAFERATLTVLGQEVLRQDEGHALVTVHWRIHGVDGPPGDGLGHLSLVMERGGDAADWRIAFAQNTQNRRA